MIRLHERVSTHDIWLASTGRRQVGGGEVHGTAREDGHVAIQRDASANRRPGDGQLYMQLAMYFASILPLHHGPIPRTTRGMCTPLASCVEGTDGAGGRAVHAVAVATSTKRRTAAYMLDMEV